MMDRPILLARNEPPKTHIDISFMNRAQKATNQTDVQATLTPGMAETIGEAAKAIAAVNGGATLDALRTTDINAGIRTVRQALLNLGQPRVGPSSGFVDADAPSVAASVSLYLEALRAAPGTRAGFEERKINAMIGEAQGLLDRLQPAPTAQPRS